MINIIIREVPGWSKNELFESFAGGWYKCVSHFPDVINVFLLILFDNEDGDDDDDEDEDDDENWVEWKFLWVVCTCGLGTVTERWWAEYSPGGTTLLEGLALRRSQRKGILNTAIKEE